MIINILRHDALPMMAGQIVNTAWRGWASQKESLFDQRAVRAYQIRAHSLDDVEGLVSLVNHT